MLRGLEHWTLVWSVAPKEYFAMVLLHAVLVARLTASLEHPKWMLLSSGMDLLHTSLLVLGKKDVCSCASKKQRVGDT